MSSCKNVSANMQTQIIIAARYIFSTHSWVTISQTYVCATIFLAVSKYILDMLTNTALQWLPCFESGFFFFFKWMSDQDFKLKFSVFARDRHWSFINFWRWKGLSGHSACVLILGAVCAVVAARFWTGQFLDWVSDLGVLGASRGYLVPKPRSRVPWI